MSVTLFVSLGTKHRRSCWGCDLDLRSVKFKLCNIINHIERKLIACTALHTEWEMRNAYKILAGNSEFDGGRLLSKIFKC
jgi:hypothetical protein